MKSKLIILSLVCSLFMTSCANNKIEFESYEYKAESDYSWLEYDRNNTYEELAYNAEVNFYFAQLDRSLINNAILDGYSFERDYNTLTDYSDFYSIISDKNSVIAYLENYYGITFGQMFTGSNDLQVNTSLYKEVVDFMSSFEADDNWVNYNYKDSFKACIPDLNQYIPEGSEIKSTNDFYIVFRDNEGTKTITWNATTGEPVILEGNKSITDLGKVSGDNDNSIISLLKEGYVWKEDSSGNKYLFNPETNERRDPNVFTEETEVYDSGEGDQDSNDSDQSFDTTIDN